MTKRIVDKCIDCGNQLSPNPRNNLHHFRCDKCWLLYMNDYSKHSLKQKLEGEK